MGAMRTPLAAAVILAALAVGRTARAEPVVGLRVAIAPAVGSAAGDVPVSDALSLQVPVQLDALWRTGPFAAGVYGSWGIARDGACGGGSCSASVSRLGIQATWSFAPISGAEPWAGIGTGYEWAGASWKRSGTSVDTRWRGLELAEAQGGVDWRLGRRLAVGPYLLVGVGRYSSYTVETAFESATAEIAQKAVHAWIHVGVRGRLSFGDAP